METGRIGIIGGSGLYDMEGIEGIRRESVDTPFGNPSDRYVIGRLHGREVVFLPGTASGTGSCRPRSTTVPTSSG